MKELVTVLSIELRSNLWTSTSTKNSMKKVLRVLILNSLCMIQLLKSNATGLLVSPNGLVNKVTYSDASLCLRMVLQLQVSCA